MPASRGRRLGRRRPRASDRCGLGSARVDLTGVASVWTFADLSEERPVVTLTQREREVAILTCRGMTSKEIGLELELSYRTVEEYRARLLRKFGARKLAELVAKLSGMPL